MIKLRALSGKLWETHKYPIGNYSQDSNLEIQRSVQIKLNYLPWHQQHDYGYFSSKFYAVLMAQKTMACDRWPMQGLLSWLRIQIEHWALFISIYRFELTPSSKQSQQELTTSMLLIRMFSTFVFKETLFGACYCFCLGSLSCFSLPKLNCWSLKKDPICRWRWKIFSQSSRLLWNLKCPVLIHKPVLFWFSRHIWGCTNFE